MEVFFVAILLFVFHLANGEKCTFSYPCSCNTADYKINLLPMMEHNRKPLTARNGNTYYYLDPCGKPLNVAKCTSLGRTVTGCQYQGSVYGIAGTTGYNAAGDPTAGTVVFTYSFQGRTTKMRLQCSSDERKFEFEKEGPTKTYNFVLSTKYACQHIPSSGGSGGLSTGSILVILFFVFLLIYIIGGILFLKYHRKAEGIEVVPNLEFWKELPLLIKDGVLFTISKFKKDSTYGQI